MPDFKHRDPTGPAFWSERFEREFTPWDRAGVPQAFRQFVEQAPVPLTTLIPGCGVGHEVAFLSELGWDVTAIDFSPVAVVAAKRNLGPWSERVVEADFFQYQPARQTDLIYERAFLCALPPAMNEAIAAHWAQLLPAGGLLAGFFFVGETPGGPPFGIAQEKLQSLLTPYFECIEDAAVEDSITVFQGKERWQVWRRKT